MTRRDHRHNIKTPHAMVLVWNYRDRVSTWNAGLSGDDTSSGLSRNDVNSIEPVIISTVSLKSISTSKVKGEPNGDFEITLAPTKNWVSTISPGSWCCILLSQEKITEEDIKRADPKKLKMLGKITSVRVNRQKNQDSGATITSYTVLGEDWGHIFNNNVYLDPLALSANSQTPSGAIKIFQEQYAESISKNGLPPTNDIISVLVGLWGQSINEFLDEATQDNLKIVVATNKEYIIPKELSRWLQINNNEIGLSGIVESHKQFGVLKKEGDNITYDSDTVESVSLMTPQDLVGVNSLWQLFNHYCNPVLNEVLCDLDFEDDKPRLRLWKRVRPFLVSRENEDRIKNDDYLNSISPEFTDIPKTVIPIDEVISFDAGTNWRDKYNFIEVRLDSAFRSTGLDNQIKLDSQIFDAESFQREGFRPMFATSRNIVPMDIAGGNSQEPLLLTRWKYLLKEWYFDTHRMLNGTISLIGQNKHIPIGSNIMIDARSFTDTRNANLAHAVGAVSHLLMHVESVSHSFSVDEDGRRHYMTNISFVRGIFTDKNGEVVSLINDSLDKGIDVDGRLDMDTRTLNPQDDKNEKTTFGTSDANDPDPQKLRGR